MSDLQNPVSEIAARRARITAFVEAPRIFDRCVLAGYPPGLIDWCPPVENGWSIREHLVHCADADLHAFIRFGKAIAESGSPVLDWNQEGWRSALSYKQQSATISLQLIRLVRSVIAARLGGLSANTWAAASCVHPVRGVITLDGLLEHLTAHIGLHDGFIKRNEALWEAASADEKQKAQACH